MEQQRIINIIQSFGNDLDKKTYATELKYAYRLYRDLCTAQGSEDLDELMETLVGLIEDLLLSKEKKHLSMKPITDDTLRDFFEYMRNADISETTARDYKNRIIWVCKQESIEPFELKDRIDHLCSLYGKGGNKEADGKRSNNSVISALKKFRSFISSDP